MIPAVGKTPPISHPQMSSPRDSTPTLGRSIALRESQSVTPRNPRPNVEPVLFDPSPR